MLATVAQYASIAQARDPARIALAYAQRLNGSVKNAFPNNDSATAISAAVAP